MEGVLNHRDHCSWLKIMYMHDMDISLKHFNGLCMANADLCSCKKYIKYILRDIQMFLLNVLLR